MGHGNTDISAFRADGQVIGQIAAVMGQALGCDIAEAQLLLPAGQCPEGTLDLHAEIAQQIAPFNIGPLPEGQ